MRRFLCPALAAALSLALFGCSSNAPVPQAKKEVPAKPEKVPDVYRVRFETSKGPFVVEVHRDWAPVGADHFYSLVKTGFYNGNRFFRYVRSFIVQFGISGAPRLNRIWSNMNLPDDPVKQSNKKGTLAFATSGPNTRATQVFINLADNPKLDKSGFAPIGSVVSGFDTIEILYSVYGDMPSMGGQGPDPTKYETDGEDYIKDNFPRLDFIRRAVIE